MLMSEENKALVRRWFAEVDKGNPTIEDQIAEGDKVVTRLRGRGTFKGECLGIPPNGKVVTIQGIAIHRIAGGKLVEHWGVADKLSFLQQMDALPSLA
jgi:predicted ester cyclase